VADTGHDNPTQSPLLEPLDSDPERLLATVFWRGDAERATLLGGLGGWDVDANLMEREGTLWRRSYTVARDLRTTYFVLPDPPDELEWTPELFRRLEVDPLNPKTWVTPPDEEDPEWGFETARSLFEGPDAPPQLWAEPRPGTPSGTTELHRLQSEILGNERRTWVHLPAGYDPSESYGLLLLFDGWAYVNLVPTPTILDNLVAAGRIPPLVAVLPDSLNQETRTRELAYHDPFVEFVTGELLPWARGRFAIGEDPTRTIVGGSSAGGLAGLYIAARRPDVFGNVLSQSAALGWSPPEGSPDVVELLGRDELPVRIYLDAGVLETYVGDQRTSILQGNRELRSRLEAAGYEVHYQEFSGGHDYVCWQGTLADGLLALLER
jgi:enterochelin esterase-like enzyme